MDKQYDKRTRGDLKRAPKTEIHIDLLKNNTKKGISNWKRARP